MTVRNAIEALLWINNEEDFQPSKELSARLTREWEAFLKTCEMIGFNPEEHRVIHCRQGDEMVLLARDWIFSRNNAGAGFLDGGWDNNFAERLHEISRTFGELETYEFRGRIYPYSIVHINKLATYCWVKYQESSSRFSCNKENPSSFMIKLPEVDNKWRRIYSICVGNGSSDLVYIKGERVGLGLLLFGEHVYVNSEAIRIEIT